MTEGDWLIGLAVITRIEATIGIWACSYEKAQKRVRGTAHCGLVHTSSSLPGHCTQSTHEVDYSAMSIGSISRHLKNAVACLQHASSYDVKPYSNHCANIRMSAARHLRCTLWSSGHTKVMALLGDGARACIG